MVEIILNDLLQPEIDGDAALLDKLRSRDYKDIFYWTVNSGLYFKKSFTEKHPNIVHDGKLRSNSPTEIRAILKASVNNMEVFDKNAASSLSVDLPLKSKILQPDKLTRAINYAMIMEKPQLLIDLIQGGNDLNNVAVEFRYSKVTPIEWAIENSHVELIKQLLKSPNITSHHLEGAFGFIKPWSEKTPEILKILVDNGANMNEYIAYAMTNDMLQLLIDLINDGTNLNVAVPQYKGSSSKISPIEWAIKKDNVEFINTLLEAYPKMKNKDSQEKSFIACINQYSYQVSEKTPETLKLLVDHGSDINEKNEYGCTILYKAVQEKEPTDVTQKLMDLGAKIDVVDNEGRTPLHYVQNTQAAKALIDAGGEVGAKSHNGGTPLHYATNAEVAELLVARGADVNATDNDKKTPLEFVLSKYQDSLSWKGAYYQQTLYKNTMTALIKCGANDSLFTANGNEKIRSFFERQYKQYTQDKELCGHLLNAMSIKNLSDLIQQVPMVFKETLIQFDVKKIKAILETMPDDEARNQFWTPTNVTALLDSAVEKPDLLTLVPANLLLEAVTNNEYNSGFSRLFTATEHNQKNFVAMFLSLPQELQIKALESRSRYNCIWDIVIQKPDLLDAIPDNLLIAMVEKIIKSGGRWYGVVINLPAERCTTLFSAVKDTIHDHEMVWIAFRMNKQSLEQRSAIYEIMKDKWPHMISFKPGYEEEFECTLQILTSEQRTDVYSAIKDKIPEILKTDYNLLGSDALKYLTVEQQAVISAIKVLMDSLEKLAAPADVIAFASALMSDDNERIKTQLDHLVSNANSPDVLLAALSTLEPVWVEKIETAKCLNMTFSSSVPVTSKRLAIAVQLVEKLSDSAQKFVDDGCKDSNEFLRTSQGLIETTEAELTSGKQLPLVNNLINELTTTVSTAVNSLVNDIDNKKEEPSTVLSRFIATLNNCLTWFNQKLTLISKGISFSFRNIVKSNRKPTDAEENDRQSQNDHKTP